MSETIKKLTPYQHVRLRTSVYYGSTTLHTQPVLLISSDQISVTESNWVPAVFTAFREIVDNSLDEVVVKGYGDKITINYDPSEMKFDVEDNGRGIPIDWDDEHKMHKATLALSELMAGRNFDNRENTAGMNGIGASGVNYCSEYFHVDIRRDGKRFQQTFREGNELFGDVLQIIEPKITKYSGPSGTKISFKLSKSVFKDMTLPLEFVKSRAFEIAYNNPLIKVVFNGHLIKTKGLISKSLFAKNTCIHLPINSKGGDFKSDFWLVTDLIESGDYSHSAVNNIPAFGGGNHIDSFKKHFCNGLLLALTRESKRRGLTPNRSDIFDGLLIYNVTTMQKPDFDSQSKTRLINDEVDRYIKAEFDDENTFKNILKQHKPWIDSIYARCAARTQKKDDADVNKANRKLMRTKVPKLLDANGRDRSKCILFICEGDSAKSSLSAVRNPDIHGALPLRGKILNVRGESNKTILENAIIADIMMALGLSLGRTADRRQMRYGQVYLAADQDPDGANITALLVNFFYLQWPELFDPKQPAVFHVFQTPFIIQEKGKKRHYWYADDYHLYNPDDWRGAPKPVRAKGLGSLEEADWIHSLATPRLISLLDDGRLAGVLDLLFNHKLADARKEFIALNGE